MGLEKREARSHRAHRPATPRSSFRDRRTGTPPAPRDTGKGPLILRGPETRLHPPRLRLIPGKPPKINCPFAPPSVKKGPHHDTRGITGDKGWLTIATRSGPLIVWPPPDNAVAAP